MKTVLRLLPIGLFLLNSALSRELLPEHWIENIPAGDDSVQQCLVFRTKPGVIYRVETSNDLANWSPGDEIYGLGNEFVTTMREFTPPPVTSGGGGGPPAGFTPVTVATLRMRRSSSPGGGMIFSWRSLDDGAQVNAVLAQNGSAEWDRMPFYFQRFGSYDFIFLCDVRFPVVAPDVNPPFGPKDAAMFAQLETSFPAMDQEVVASVERSRHASPPVPPDPDGKKFWRVHCDWSADTDGDGSPDWMEFEMAASGNGALVSGVAADAFGADTNGDGIADGDQLDFDDDGVADAQDLGNPGQEGSQDALIATWAEPPAMQFAAFDFSIDQIVSGVPVLDDVSDNGTLLFTDWLDTSPENATRIIVDRDMSVHTCPSYIQPLTEADGDFQSYAATLIGDRVLGIFTVVNSQSGYLENKDYLWDLTTASPTNSHIPFTMLSGYHDDILDDRPVSRVTANLDFSTPGGKLLTPHGFLPDSGTFGGTRGNTRIEANGNVTTAKGYWRLQGQAYGGVLPLPEEHAAGTSTATLEQLATGSAGSIQKWNLVPGATSLLVAKDSGGFQTSRVTWPAGQQPVGATRDGWVATGGMIWNHSRWTPLKRYFSAMDPTSTKMLHLLDTGLGVAELEYLPNEFKTYLLMSISADGVSTGAGAAAPESLALGVDRISMLAESGNARVPEIWIMAPNGGTKSVRFRTPATAENTLTLSTDSKVTITPSVLNSGDTTVQIAGTAPATENVDVEVIKTGNRHAANAPIKIKAMKKRTVKVALHKVYSVDANGTTVAPVHMPTETGLENYLNQVYEPQVNVRFDVIPCEEGTASAGVDFDLGTVDDRLDFNDTAEVQAATPNAKSIGANPTANIDVWVIGGDISLMLTPALGTTKYLAYGGHLVGTSKIIVDGNVLRNHQLRNPEVQAGKEADHLLHTIAHEIGHVMTKDEHPGDVGYDSALNWTGGADPYVKKRLMCSGGDANHRNPGTCLIKKEWDRIEAWLKAEEERIGRSL